MTFSPDGKLLVTSHPSEKAGKITEKIWDAATGQLLRTIESQGFSIAFLPDGAHLAAATPDGLVNIFSVADGSLAAYFASGKQAQWAAITTEGFMSGPPGGADILSISRGLSGMRASQLYQSFFNPDLVREKLAGDPRHEVKAAAGVLNLGKVLDSGQAPLVEILSPTVGAHSDEEVIQAEARIEDQGGGIGRIEWRLNGVTAGVSSLVSRDRERTVVQNLALEPGDNTIEVVAYNARNLIASIPARTSVSRAWMGIAGHETGELYVSFPDAAKPKLHVLAIGINAYDDPGYAQNASQVVRFDKLNLAVDDARAFGSAVEKAGGGFYEEVRVTYALDEDARLSKLEEAIDRIASEIHPRDTFVLFAASHGHSERGRFYLIPQDYKSGPDALARHGIGQDRLQDWIANRIKAKKALILLDTCESGALIAGHLQSRTDGSASEAAVGRLHEATGRAVLTASAAGQAALEGYNGHGVFTWAVMDALRNGDSNGNGLIELSELVGHVQNLVPKLAAEMQGTGRALVAIPHPEISQSARFGSRGDDFSLISRLQ